MNTLKQILVATDFGEASNTALLYGRDLAVRFDATLHVLHVVNLLAGQMQPIEGYVPNLAELQAQEEQDAQQRLNALISDEDRQRLGARVVLRVSSLPAEEIVGYARDTNIDLILIGTHGRKGVARFFIGSVAERVVREAPCPVLTVRHPEHEFVVPDPPRA